MLIWPRGPKRAGVTPPPQGAPALFDWFGGPSLGAPVGGEGAGASEGQGAPPRRVVRSSNHAAKLIFNFLCGALHEYAVLLKTNPAEPRS